MGCESLPESPVKLGLMPPLTGLVAMYGLEISRAGQIACAEVNENGGVLGRPLELVIEDDGSLPDSAVAAANRLLDRHGCVALIGNLLSNSRIAVAYQVAEPRQTPYLNFSFYEGSILSRYFFHFAALPNQQIDRMIPYMRRRFGPRMFFAGNNYEWPRGSVDAAKRALLQAGGEVLGEEYRPIGVAPAAIDELLEQVAAAKPDVFVPYFAGADQVNLLTRFTDKGMKAHMAVVMGHYDEAMASQLPAAVREGFYSSNTYFMTLDTPANQAYLQRLAALPDVGGVWPKGDGVLTNFGEGAYLCVKAFAQAANQAGSLEAEALVEALAGIRVDGPQGEVQMDPAIHHARVNTYLSCCQADGSFAIVERFGAIEPLLPERYRHLSMGGASAQREDVYLQARMIGQMTEAVFLIRAADGIIVYANAAAEHLFGHGPEELRRLHFSALFAPGGETPEQTAAALGQILPRKGVWRGDIQAIRRDGWVFWSELSVSVFTHPKHGEVWMFLAKDITERRRVEEALRKSEFLFRTFFELGNMGVAITSPEKGWVRVNPRLCRMLGYEEGELVRMTWAEMTHPDDLQPDVVQFERMLAGDIESYEMDKRFIRKDGSLIYTHLTVACYRNEGKVQFVIAGLLDISDSKQAEQELLLYRTRLEQLVDERTAELRRQQVFTETVLDNISDGIVACDAAGTLSLFNRATREIHGLDREDLPPERWSERYRLLQADGATPLPTEQIPLFRAFRGENVRDQELAVAHAKGRKRTLLCSGQPMYDKQGAKIGAVVSMHDVTAQRQAEAELIRARDVAEAANRAKSVFLANMSHELRTPLNAILGFAQLMGHDERLAEPHRRELATIERAGRHLLELINDVLAISRIEAGRIEMQKEAFDLEDTLRSVEEMIRVRAKSKDLAFLVLAQGSLPRYVRGDAPHLRQVLINLLGNAVKYSDSGQVCLRIAASGERIRFEVADSGPGIRPEEQQRIFEAFYQTETGERKGEGTGLGLAISRKFVRMMGGELTVESEPGRGSVFAFDLALPEVEAPALAGRLGRVMGLVPGQAVPRVLVVEDHPDNRELINRLLAAVGFDVQTVEDGKQAVERFSAWRPHFIWMDMRMPVLDGYQATRQIRALPGGDRVKIVALTASAFQEDRAGILAAGCDDLLAKPVDEERLFQIMGELLQLRYRYSASEMPAAPAPAVSRMDLSGLEEALRDALGQAARELDMAACEKVIERIRQQNPGTAEGLAALLDEFKFERILQALGCS